MYRTLMVKRDACHSTFTLRRCPFCGADQVRGFNENTGGKGVYSAVRRRPHRHGFLGLRRDRNCTRAPENHVHATCKACSGTWVEALQFEGET